MISLACHQPYYRRQCSPKRRATSTNTRIFWLQHEGLRNSSITLISWKGFQEENKSHYGISSNELNLFKSFLLKDDLMVMRANYSTVAHTYHKNVMGLTLTNGELDCFVEKGFGDGEVRGVTGWALIQAGASHGDPKS